MEKLLFILALMPLVGFANRNTDLNSFATFKYACANEKDPALRQKYCNLVQQQINAETIASNFQKK